MKLSVGFLPNPEIQRATYTKRGKPCPCKCPHPGSIPPSRLYCCRVHTANAPLSWEQIMQALGELRRQTWFLFVMIGKAWWRWPHYEAIPWWGYLEPAGDSLLCFEEKQAHCMVRCTWCFSAWLMSFIAQSASLEQMSGLSTQKPHFPSAILLDS